MNTRRSHVRKELSPRVATWQGLRKPWRGKQCADCRVLDQDEEAGGPEDVQMLSRRLLQVLRSEIVIAGHDVVVGTSIGVAIAAPGDDAAALLRNADMAMYRAKAMGKNRDFVYQPSLREENIRKLELIEALRRGIADELVVHYQPVVDLDSGHVLGLEADVQAGEADLAEAGAVNALARDER